MPAYVPQSRSILACMTPTPRDAVDILFAQMVFTRSDLHESGFSRRTIDAAVREGRLIRLRRDRYVRPTPPDQVLEAGRLGGRVTCLSLLQMLGVFVLRVDAVHVRVDRNRSRFRGHRSRARLHWSTSTASPLLHVTTVAEAIRHSVRCQDPRASVATLDSVLHHRLATRAEIETIFADLPVRYRVLLDLVDSAAESGPETLMRLILRTLGVSIATQVWIGGRVDFVVDGWLIIECDSKQFHEGWDKQVADRRRDIAAARLGYVTVRPLASDVLYHPEQVRAAIQDILESCGTGSRPQLRKRAR